MRNSKVTSGVMAAVLLSMSLLALLAATPSASAHFCQGGSVNCGDCKATLTSVFHYHYDSNPATPYCLSVGTIGGGSQTELSFEALRSVETAEDLLRL